eukprot:jgi/Psemu1/11359/gm1.11359_g
MTVTPEPSTQTGNTNIEAQEIISTLGSGAIIYETRMMTETPIQVEVKVADDHVIRRCPSKKHDQGMGHTFLVEDLMSYRRRIRRDRRLSSLNRQNDPERPERPGKNRIQKQVNTRKKANEGTVHNYHLEDLTQELLGTPAVMTYYFRASQNLVHDRVMMIRLGMAVFKEFWTRQLGEMIYSSNNKGSVHYIEECPGTQRTVTRWAMIPRLLGPSIAYTSSCPPSSNALPT